MDLKKLIEDRRAYNNFIKEILFVQKDGDNIGALCKKVTSSPAQFLKLFLHLFEWYMYLLHPSVVLQSAEEEIKYKAEFSNLSPTFHFLCKVQSYE